MTYTKIVITQEQPSIVNLKADKRYLKLKRIYSLNTILPVEVLIKHDIKLKYTIQNNGHSFSELISLNHYQLQDVNNKDFLDIDLTIDQEKLINVDEVKFEILFAVNKVELEAHFDLDNLDISVTDPLLLFRQHLNQPDNPKILFSAPFGHGKTTFLKLFFEEHLDKYEVFHLYPVNYSVAQNEDIFKYIKTELLFQLLGKDVEFDKEKVPYVKTLLHYLGRNAHNVLTPFIKLIPGIGKSAFEIYDKINKLKEEYFNEHAEQQVNEEAKVQSYIQDIYEQEGSIYEDNFYTQLIRQLIEQVNAKGKQTVLIIDDMDRMDPDHIFRILNVLSAHSDSVNNLTDAYSNKFGITKTILVADYNNLTSIFTHKYGETTDHRGYFDKFFSRNIYEYDNIKSLQNFIDALPEKLNYSPDSIGARFFNQIMTILSHCNQISLRELLVISRKKPDKLFNLKPTVFIKELPLSSIRFLLEIYGSAELLKRLMIVKSRFSQPIERLDNLNYNTWHLIHSISKKINDNRFRYHLDNEKYIEYNIELSNGLTATISSYHHIDRDHYLTEIDDKDFIEVLINVVNTYSQNQMKFDQQLNKAIHYDF